MTDVRVTTTTPVVSDFRDSKNSPIVIDESTDVAYYLVNETVTPLKALTGMCYGGFYQYEVPTTITITVQGDYYQITGNSAGPLLDMTFSSDALTIGQTGVYLVSTTASYSDGGNTNFETAIFVDGVKNEMSACHAATTGNLYNQASGTAIISITENQVVDLRIVNQTNTNNVDIEHCAVTLVRIS